MIGIHMVILETQCEARCDAMPIMKLSSKPCPNCSTSKVLHKMLAHNTNGCQIVGCDNCKRKPE